MINFDSYESNQQSLDYHIKYDSQETAGLYCKFYSTAQK